MRDDPVKSLLIETFRRVRTETPLPGLMNGVRLKRFPQRHRRIGSSNYAAFCRLNDPGSLVFLHGRTPVRRPFLSVWDNTLYLSVATRPPGIRLSSLPYPNLMRPRVLIDGR